MRAHIRQSIVTRTIGRDWTVIVLWSLLKFKSTDQTAIWKPQTMWNRVRNDRENDSFLALFRMASGFEVSKLSDQTSSIRNYMSYLIIQSNSYIQKSLFYSNLFDSIALILD